MNSERRSLGFLSAELMPRPDWLSTRIPETYLELSTCFGHVQPDELPFWTDSHSIPRNTDVKTRLIEFGISSEDAYHFQSAEDVMHIQLLEAPKGEVLGYAVIDFEWGGFGWHTQHCHNFADSNEGQSIVFNNFGLIERREDAVQLAEWYNQGEIPAEPGLWLPVSVHGVDLR